MLLAPHFLIAQAFTVLTLCLFMRAEHSGLQRDYILASLCCLVVGTLRPYDLLYLMAAFTLYIIVTGLNKISNFFSYSYPRLLVSIVPVPLIAYYLWLFKVHPIFRWWSIQGDTPLHYQVAWSSVWEYRFFCCFLAQVIWEVSRKRHLRIH